MNLQIYKRQDVRRILFMVHLMPFMCHIDNRSRDFFMHVCKLDHVISSCIVEMVYVVKVVNIVGSRYTGTVRCRRLSCRLDSDHTESESGSLYKLECLKSRLASVCM